MSQGRYWRNVKNTTYNSFRCAKSHSDRLCRKEAKRVSTVSEEEGCLGKKLPTKEAHDELCRGYRDGVHGGVPRLCDQVGGGN